MSINFFNRKPVETEYVDYEAPAPESEVEEGSMDELMTSKDTLVTSEIMPTSDVGRKTIYKKAAQWVLLIGVALLPLLFLPWTTSALELNKQMLLVAVAGAGLILWLLDVVMSGRLSWRFNPLDKGVVALAGAVALSSVFSMAGFKSVFGIANDLSDSLLSVVSLTVIYLLVVNSFDDKGKVLRTFFSISLTVALLYGLLQMLGVHIFSIFRYFDISLLNFTVSRAFNTLGSVNVLGVVSAVMLPILYSSRVLIRVSIFRLRYFNISRVGVLLALVILVVINWWVLWVVAIAGMVAVVVLESISRKTYDTEHEMGFRISKFLFPMTVMVVGIFLIVVNLNLVFVKNSLPVEIAPSYGLSWKVAFKALQDNFAFGYGPENFSLAFDKYGVGELHPSLSGVKLFDSTSYVLNMAVHNGLVGLAALGFVLWLLGWSLFKAARSRLASLDSESIGVISATVAAIVAMFLYPFNLILIFSFYVILALLVLAVWDSQRVTYNVEEKVSLSLVSSLGFIGGLILVLVGLYFMSLNYIADVKYAKALEQTETENALNYVVKAINWKSQDDRFYRLSSQLSLILLSRELNTQPVKDNTQRTNRIQNYLSAAVALAQRATQVAPNEANNWSNLGNVYQNLMRLVDGADVLAETAYLKASELRPGDPTFHNRIGSMYLVKADLLKQLAAGGDANVRQFNQQAVAALLKAEDAFKQAIEKSDSFGLAIYNLGSVYERQGKLNEAIKQLETVVPFNSNQPGLAFELGLLYYRANQKDKAFDQLQRAVVLFPDYANARWYLALIYEERKQLKQAIEQLEKIISVEANKNNKVVLDKLDELKAGRVSIPPGNVLDEKPL